MYGKHKSDDAAFRCCIVQRSSSAILLRIKMHAKLLSVLVIIVSTNVLKFEKLSSSQRQSRSLALACMHVSYVLTVNECDR